MSGDSNLLNAMYIFVSWWSGALCRRKFELPWCGV